jgi:pimeloyl-ACP methyl ester carboxylesterase
MLLKGWLMLQPNAKQCDTIVFMHENAGNIGLRMDYFQLLYAQGYNIMCVAYRGYSESTGIPTERGLKLDGIAISECIRQQRDKIDLDRLYLIGRSLGGAVAINTLKEVPGLFKAAII